MKSPGAYAMPGLEKNLLVRTKRAYELVVLG